MKPRSPLAAPRSIDTLTPPGGGMLLSEMERPVSVLGIRGVTITEIKDLNINPNPVMLEESEVLMEEYLSPRKLVNLAIIDDDSLRDLTGQDDLTEVTFLEMRVNTQETSLGNFGVHLPKLLELKLSNSIITSVRDLGSSLQFLSVLWMARCGLEDLGGLSTMNNLCELYLAFNEISDIGPCSMLEKLQTLDLEGNNIDELSQVEFLTLCSSLSSITLDGNPVCTTPSPDQAVPDYDYRDAVRKLLPNIRLLDDEPLVEHRTAPKPGAAQPSCTGLEDDWKFLEQVMADTNITSVLNEDAEEIAQVIPGTSSGSGDRPLTSYRPGSALKQTVPGTSRPLTGRARSAGSRPSSARPVSARPTTARPSTSNKDEEEDTTAADSSDLTMGVIVCGNPSKALRSRSQGNSPLTKSSTPPKFTAHTVMQKYSTVKKSSNKTPEEPMQLQMDENLSEEIQKWRKSHQKKQTAIRASKEAQVLTISHDDNHTITDSDSDAVDSDTEITQPYPLPQTPAGGARPRSSRPTSSRGVSTSSYRPQINAASSHGNTDAGHDESYEVLTSPSKPDDTLQQSLSVKLSMMDTKPLDRMTRPNGMKSGKIRLEPMSPATKTPLPISKKPISPPDSRQPTKTPPGQPSRIRRAHLANVPLLPSKFKS